MIYAEHNQHGDNRIIFSIQRYLFRLHLQLNLSKCIHTNAELDF